MRRIIIAPTRSTATQSWIIAGADVVSVQVIFTFKLPLLLKRKEEGEGDLNTATLNFKRHSGFLSPDNILSQESL